MERLFFVLLSTTILGQSARAAIHSAAITRAGHPAVPKVRRDRSDQAENRSS